MGFFFSKQNPGTLPVPVPAPGPHVSTSAPDDNILDVRAGPITFFFMGCWNRFNCDENVDYRMAVIRAIREQQERYAFGLIAGDNIYQFGISYGETKVKLHSKAVFNEGFNELQTINKPQFVILGNHDVESSFGRKDGHIRQAQLAKSRKGFEVVEEKFVLLLSKNRIRGCLFLIDTNNKKGLGKSIENLLNQLNNRIIPEGIPIFIIGHEPLITLKWKFDKGRIKKKDDFSIIQNMNSEGKLSELLNSYGNITYLCADVHMYQDAEITIPGTDKKIKMIVSGTGGADPDPVPETITIDNRNTQTDGAYSITIHRAQSPYGYTEVTMNENGSTGHNYIPVCSQANSCPKIKPEEIPKRCDIHEKVRSMLKKGNLVTMYPELSQFFGPIHSTEELKARILSIERKLQIETDTELKKRLEKYLAVLINHLGSDFNKPATEENTVLIGNTNTVSQIPLSGGGRRKRSSKKKTTKK